MIRTYSIQTLGCRVNQYESEQLATLLRSHGLHPSDAADADLRIINTCSVTVQAAGKSRQMTRRATAGKASARTLSLPQLPARVGSSTIEASKEPFGDAGLNGGDHPSQSKRPASRRPRVMVTGCWATSDPEAAGQLAGVDAVVGHHHDVAAELARLLALWQGGENKAGSIAPDHGHDQNSLPNATYVNIPEVAPKRLGNDGWMIEASTPAGDLTADNRAISPSNVNAKSGTTALPLLDERQSGRQRAYLKVQDGCDAHCTYCIIPTLRPKPWSKPITDAIEEARRLVAAGHVELVLTGIFLGAYGQPTALRRRQATSAGKPLGELVEALCSQVTGLKRIRLSSLEPGDLNDDLLSVLTSHPQVVPHLHLPLQSGSELLLRRMNRQYTRDDFLRMIDRVHNAFDRPAITTDIIVGFPGETDNEFDRTLEVAAASRFIHIHAFSFSPRPGTAAARWTKSFVRGPLVNDRINRLRAEADAQSLSYRRQFLGETVEVLVERSTESSAESLPGHRHGRCERYFDVHFPSADVRPGDFVRVRIDEVLPGRTLGTILAPAEAAV